MNEAHKRYSISATRLRTRFVTWALQKNFYNEIKKTYYMSASLAGQHVVSFGHLGVDMFLEVQSKRCGQLLYLINYIVYGLHLRYQMQMLPTYFPTSWLNDKFVYCEANECRSILNESNMYSVWAISKRWAKEKTGQTA